MQTFNLNRPAQRRLSVSMNEWFHRAFGAHYLSLYAHRDEEEARATVELLRRATRISPGSRVLDAPCGAGRHAREFARHGYVTIALDLSRDLLDAATAEHEPGEASPVYLRADIRAIPAAAESFDLIANLFSSFGYFATDAQNFSVLHEFARVCRTGGYVALDFFNAQRVSATLEPKSERTTPEGCIVRETRQISGNPPRVEKRTHIESKEGDVMETCESVRLFTPTELVNGMEKAGLEIVSQFGDYAGTNLSDNSPRVILVGRKR